MSRDFLGQALVAVCGIVAMLAALSARPPADRGGVGAPHGQVPAPLICNAAVNDSGGDSMTLPVAIDDPTENTDDEGHGPRSPAPSRELLSHARSRTHVCDAAILPDDAEWVVGVHTSHINR